MEGFKIRQMSLSDLRMAVEWARNEGWNPGNDDYESFHDADPDGFFLGCLDDVPIACISAVKYSTDFGFIGFYIVKAEFRGNGYGIQMWRHALHSFESRNVDNVGLDGVLGMEEIYLKSGFSTAHRTIRFQGPCTVTEDDESDPCPASDELHDLAAIDFDALAAYDSTAFPAPRPAFLRSWIHRPCAAALACVREGRLVGYAVARPAHHGFRVGPLFADDPAAAQGLLRALIARCSAAAAAAAGGGGGGPAEIFIDVPESHAAAVAMARRRGMTPAFATARMYTRGPPPGVAPGRVYAVTSLELG
jgi:GNAT superfamily N-acetyltransferase